MKKLKCILMCGLLATSLLGCGASNKPQETPSQSSQVTESTSQAAAEGQDTVNTGKTELNMPLSVDPDGLDPQRTTAASTFQITNNIYEPLLSVNTDGTLKPALATDWSVSEDGLTITFTLREGAKFSNGNVCDANAVVASFERLKGEESPRANDYKNIVSMEAIDEKTVVFTTETLDVTILSSFAYPWAAIVDVTAADTLKNQPVGTGAYVVEEWIPQQSLVLKKNPDYPGTVNLEKINFKNIPDATAQISAFHNGELDIIGISGDQIAAFENDNNYKMMSAPANSLQLMAMNLENEALSDERVRQAINYAIDKDALIETVWWGAGEKIGSHYPTVLKEYVDYSNQYPYNVEKAKELLKEAGYENGLTLQMYLPKSYPAYVDAGQIIANQLKEINITCEVTIIEWAEWLSDVYNGRQYDLTVVGHTGRLDPYVLLARYHSESSENYFNYKNEEVDELLTNYKSEMDEEKRTEITKRIEQILAEEVPALYIQTPITNYVMQKDVEGFASYPIDIYEMKDVYFTGE